MRAINANNKFVTHPGRANVIIDGQFGSTGKGLIAGYIGVHEGEDVHWATTNAAPNAGHSCTLADGRKIVTHHFPMVGLVRPSVQMALNAGAIIDPQLLHKEMNEFNIDPDRVFIHPRAAVICQEDVDEEKQITSGPTKIASTQHGVGAALKRKIDRTATLAGEHPLTKQFTKGYPQFNELLGHGAVVTVEIPQGHGLGINSGYAYPYCTSREISVAQALSDAQIHPEFLGNVLMTMRTYPIRVGNIVVDGQEVGKSGPFWPDSAEVTWQQLGLAEERTTVTKRVRRVATFSIAQYAQAVRDIRPTHLFINFMNYLKGMEDVGKFWSMLAQHTPLLGVEQMVYYGVGPTVTDVLTDGSALADFYATREATTP